MYDTLIDCTPIPPILTLVFRLGCGFPVYGNVFKAATGKHFVALLESARRSAEAAEARLAKIVQEHKGLSAAIEDLKKRRDAALEAAR